MAAASHGISAVVVPPARGAGEQRGRAGWHREGGGGHRAGTRALADGASEVVFLPKLHIPPAS